MTIRLAEKIASQYMTESFPQPLRLQPDYGERNAADFLGDRNVARNTGYGDRLKAGPGNAFDEVVADEFEAGLSDGFVSDDFEADFLADDFEADDFEAEDFEAEELEADDFEADDFEAEELEGFEIVDDLEGGEGFEMMGEMLKESHLSSDEEGFDRFAHDHEDTGSYMSRQNLREISDMADFIVDDIGMDDLDDWVEDKISHAHSAMNDVARYRGYRDTNDQGIIDDIGLSREASEDEIIDDLDLMGKEARVPSAGNTKWKEVPCKTEGAKGPCREPDGTWSEKDVKDYYENVKDSFGDEWAKYEGAMTPEGLNQARIQRNTEGKKAGVQFAPHDEIIDDLEW